MEGEKKKKKRLGREEDKTEVTCLHAFLCIDAVSLTDIAGGRTADRGQSREGGGGHEEKGVMRRRRDGQKENEGDRVKEGECVC